MILVQYTDIFPSTKYKLIYNYLHSSNTVPPAVPNNIIFNLTPFENTMTWSHTNITNDEAPETIQLSLFNNNDEILEEVTLSGVQTEYKFTNLIPATDYSVFLSVSNVDGTQSFDEAINFTTETSGM